MLSLVLTYWGGGGGASQFIDNCLDLDIQQQAVAYLCYIKYYVFDAAASYLQSVVRNVGG